MAVTIRDIARESGYAVGTVSRVLNHHPDVSETARQRIMEVVEAHGFTPNSNARHLKQSVSRSVAIIVKGSSNLLFADMVERAQNCLQSRGFDTAVHYLDEDANEVAFAAIVAREYKPRGFLFLGGNLDCFRSDFAAISAPAVLLTNSARGMDFPNLSSVTTDDLEAARCAIDSLKDLPGRHVAILADMLEMGSGGEQMHRELGRYAVENGMDLVLCCGPLGREIAEGAGSRGQWFESRQALAEALPELLEKGDTVLVKASRGMHLEEISEQLKTM